MTYYVTDTPRVKVEYAKYTLVNLSMLGKSYYKFKDHGDAVVNVGHIDKFTFLGRSVRDPSIEEEIEFKYSWGNYDSFERANEVVKAISAGITPLKEPIRFHQAEATRLIKLQRDTYRDVLAANET